MEIEISKFREVIGNSPTARIIEYLIECEDLDFSLTDISEGANVSWTTLHRVWKGLETTGIVKYTRNIGNAKLFTLNKDNAVAKALISLFHKSLLVEEKVQQVEMAEQG